MGYLGAQVVAFAERFKGQQVGRGECVDLADEALKSAGAKSYGDFKDIVSPSDRYGNYHWSSTEVHLMAALPGDIIQFSHYRFLLWKERKKLRIPKSGLQVGEWLSRKEAYPDWAYQTLPYDVEEVADPNAIVVDCYSGTRPHHTAIILENYGYGHIRVAEQNYQRHWEKHLVRKVGFTDLWMIGFNVFDSDSVQYSEGNYWIQEHTCTKCQVQQPGLNMIFRPEPK